MSDQRISVAGTHVCVNQCSGYTSSIVTTRMSDCLQAGKSPWYITELVNRVLTFVPGVRTKLIHQCWVTVILCGR